MRGHCQCTDDDKYGMEECVRCTEGDQVYNDRMNQGIADDGFVIVGVIDADPPFAYTIGLTDTFARPEFIICGKFHMDMMGMVLGDAVAHMRDDVTLFDNGMEVPRFLPCSDPDGGETPILASIGCRPIGGHIRRTMMGQATARYGPDGYRAVQLVIPDSGLKLPWHDGYDEEWGKNQFELYLLDDDDIDPGPEPVEE